MELLFIRHGEPAWAVDGQARMDPDLTERGRAQARRVAERLQASRRKIDELIVSSAARSQQTAAPIADALGLTAQVIPELTEIKMPDWSQTPAETVQSIFAGARSRPLDDWWEGIPGGESFRAFHERITGALETLLRERGAEPDPETSKHAWKVHRPGRRIAIVAHGGTNAVALGHLLGLEPTPWEWERFSLFHASITKLRAVPLGADFVFSLRAANDVEHLPRPLRSG